MENTPSIVLRTSAWLSGQAKFIGGETILVADVSRTVSFEAGSGKTKYSSKFFTLRVRFSE